MLRSVYFALSIGCVLVAPTAAIACTPTPFDLHIVMATRALQAKKLEPGMREEAERLLAAARDGKVPWWHGERQQALNKALAILSMPEATRAPLEELSPHEQETQHLRLDELTTDELAARDAWYAEMDAADEWMGMIPEAHIDCAESIIFFFEKTIPEITEQLDGKPFMLRDKDGTLDWHFLRITETLAVLRKDAAALLLRIAPTRTQH